MSHGQPKILVGMSTCNIAAGAKAVYEACVQHLREQGQDAALGITGCLGLCHSEPQIQVIEPDGRTSLYIDMTPAKVARLVEQHLGQGRPVDALIADFDKEPNRALMAKQQRIVLANCGHINPEQIEDYLAVDGYKALEKALAGTPEEVIETVTGSGLRGRGGAGFPTGVKWKFAMREQADKKYVICNADEGDPGAFMDRTTLESDPHALLEGMAIQAYATGADEGVIYCRAEYPLAVKRLNLAIEQARTHGFLGERICGTKFCFDLHVKEGAGAFVCGEETALMASIEGQRGMPRLRPPFPAQSGLFGKPTTINNVETLASVPWIVRNGAEAFAAIGTEKSKGTKVFALAGKIRNGGLVEVPMGITLGEIVHDIGGGTFKGRTIKAVQMGGPSGGCVPESLFQTRIDYDEVTSTGAIMGSGGMIVMDNTTCMVDVARYFLNFTQEESCGKCTFCRIGTKRMLEILTRICEGEGVMEDLDKLEDLAVQIKSTSLCGLGQTAPNPVLTTLRYFREEYQEHIQEKRCRAGKCRNLCSYIITDRCTGCTLCVRNCPAACITGERKKLHAIDQESCIRCGVCRDVCKFNAVEVQ